MKTNKQTNNKLADVVKKPETYIETVPSIPFYLLVVARKRYDDNGANVERHGQQQVPERTNDGVIVKYT